MTFYIKKYLVLHLFFIGSFFGAYAQIPIIQSAIPAVTDAGDGDYYLTTDSNRLYLGLQSGFLREIGNNGNNSAWLLGGNSAVSSSQFLGATNDVAMEIRSNNLPMMRFGRRQTLGLTQSFLDYNDPNQALIQLNGDGITSALQFTASAASFYRPMFFTTTNGSFRLKGSAGKTDFFEIGSAGPNNDGRLEFIIGDDGSEPIVFKRFDYRGGQFHTELFRVQASSNSENAKPRFGININPAHVAIPSNYYDTASGGNIANSTLQVGGSVSTAIVRINASLILSEDHYTVIMTSGNPNITLPAANSCKGRIYRIKNYCGSNRTITQYRADNGNNSTQIRNDRVYTFQSDGVEWQQINKE